MSTRCALGGTSRSPALDTHTHLDGLAVALLLGCSLFWGFQQVLVKATVAEVASVFQAFVCFALATAVLLLWCRWHGIAVWRRDAVLGPGLLAGALFAGEVACIYTSLQYTRLRA